MAQYFLLHKEGFLIENPIENISLQKITPPFFLMLVVSPAYIVRDAYGSPSPPYKDSPNRPVIGEDLLTYWIPIGGIKREPIILYYSY